MYVYKYIYIYMYVSIYNILTLLKIKNMYKIHFPNIGCSFFSPAFLGEVLLPACVPVPRTCDPASVGHLSRLVHATPCRTRDPVAAIRSRLGQATQAAAKIDQLTMRRSRSTSSPSHIGSGHILHNTYNAYQDCSSYDRLHFQR